MANFEIFDPTYQTTKVIAVTQNTSVIIQDLDGDNDYYVQLATSATEISGNAILNTTIRSLTDGAGGGGTTKHDGSALPYATFSEAVTDHINRMVEGDLIDPTTAMDFSS
jgi:hypothetical protein